MKNILIMLSILFLTTNIFATEEIEEEIVINKSITTVSNDTRQLLLAEMRFIEQNMKDILFLIVSGQFEKIEKKALGIQESFVFKKSITKEQIKEIQKKLPKKFFLIDYEFHQTAGQMAQAAGEMEDAGLVAEEYYNMLKTCVQCHSTFATHRFPNLIE